MIFVCLLSVVISALNTRTRRRVNGGVVTKMHCGNRARSRHATVSTHVTVPTFYKLIASRYQIKSFNSDNAVHIKKE